jgi:serine/threonine protein kinase/tetratricopeptide (TPR) repeat protein
MAATSPIPGEVLGHFRLVEQIGAGGMGIVFRAHDLRLQRDVAVKILNAKTLNDPSGRRRFRREALVLSKLNHPNVESVYEFPDDENVDYIVMEFVPGTSLDDRLERGPIPEAEAIGLAIQLARGLAAAHARGIIHRDLKPGNLRVTPENILKILDFGLSQLLALPDEETVTEAFGDSSHSVLGGTLPYMAPEQLQGKPPDTRSDVYSAGVVLYEMATGSRPFIGRGLALHDAILGAQPPTPRQKQPELSAEFESVILKCLQKDANARYQSAGDLLTELSRVAAEQDISVKTERWSRKKMSRRKFWGSTAAVVVLAAIATGAFLLRPPHVEAHQKIMAVLPFDAIGQNSAANALGVGLMETVATKLGEADSEDKTKMEIVAPHELSDKGVKTASDARREFGTDVVLEGSLQQSGNELRITCNLVDSKTGRQIGARTITRDANDIFRLQDETVNAALEMLADARIQVLHHEASVTPPETQPAAYEAYMRGRGYLEELNSPENVDRAVAEFTSAVNLDPKYALGYAALGNAYRLGFQEFAKGKQWVSAATQNCEKALSLNPILVEGHICLGNLYNATGQYAGAAEEFQRALQSEPGSEYALMGLANTYTHLGKFSEAEANYKKAISLRPQYWRVYSALGLFYYDQGRYAEAAEMFRKVTQLAPENYLGYSNLAAMDTALGNYQDAIVALGKTAALSPSWDVYANLCYTYYLMHHFTDAVAVSEEVKPPDRKWQNWGNLADALYWTRGRQSDANEAYRKAIALAQAEVDVNPQDGETMAYIADYYAMLGDRNAAYANLRNALKVAPEDSEVWFRAALVHNHFGETKEALSFLKRAGDAHYSRAIIRDTPDLQELLRNTTITSDSPSESKKVP